MSSTSMEAVFRSLSQGLSFPKAPLKRAKKTNILTHVPDPKVLKMSNVMALEVNDEEVNNETIIEESNESATSITLLGSLQSSSSSSTFMERSKCKRGKRASAAMLHEERVNAFRNVHRIRVRLGDGQAAVEPQIPDPLSSWDALEALSNTNHWPLELLRSRYTSGPTAVQMQTWPSMLKGQELLVCAPTGSGKTAAYLLPLATLVKPKVSKAIVIAPTRELALQIGREANLMLSKSKLTTLVLEASNGDMSNFDVNKASKFDVLVTTPNRLVYLIKDKKIDMTPVKFLIVDEADRLFEGGFDTAGKNGDNSLTNGVDGTSTKDDKRVNEGGKKSKKNVQGLRKEKSKSKKKLTSMFSSFRDQLHFILSHSQDVKRFFFSATLTSALETWCKAHLNSHWLLVTIGIRNSACSDVKQRLVYTKTEKGKLVALNDLIVEGLKPPILIFVQSKDRAQELYDELVKLDVRCEAIHSDQSLLQRDQAVQGFRSGRVWMLICTDLMARGIDFKGVNVVINYDLPNSTLNYIHRVGRTGRAGRQGEAVTFFTDADQSMIRSIAQIVKDSGSPVPQYFLSMKKCSREERKRRAVTAVKRQSVNVRTAFEKREKERRREMIEGSKRRKAKRQRKQVEGMDKDDGSCESEAKHEMVEVKKTTKKKKKKMKGAMMD